MLKKKRKEELEFKRVKGERGGRCVSVGERPRRREGGKISGWSRWREEMEDGT